MLSNATGGRQTDVSTYTGPVSVQPLQLGPDRGHAVVENLQGARKLCVTAGTGGPAVRLPAWHRGRTISVRDECSVGFCNDLSGPLLELPLLAAVSCSLRLWFCFCSEALTLFSSSMSCWRALTEQLSSAESRGWKTHTHTQGLKLCACSSHLQLYLFWCRLQTYCRFLRACFLNDDDTIRGHLNVLQTWL